MEITQRKKLRLDEFDYSQNGAYFTTICTQNKQHLFGVFQNGHLVLSEAGKMVKQYIEEIVIYGGVTLDKYVIMPNHVHA